MIYVVQQGSDGPVKIGCAGDVDKRMRSLRTASPHPLNVLFTFKGSLAKEKSLHLKLAPHRLEGEWFRPHPDVMRMVAHEAQGMPARERSTTPATDSVRLNGVPVEVAMDESTFGRYCAAARVKGGVTLSALGRILSLSPQYLSDVEHDRRRPNPQRWHAFAVALQQGVTVRGLAERAAMSGMVEIDAATLTTRQRAAVVDALVTAARVRP